MVTPGFLLLLVGTVVAQAENVGGATSLHGTRLQASTAALHNRGKPLPGAMRAANKLDKEDAAQIQQVAFKDKPVRYTDTEEETRQLLRRIQDILQQEKKRLSWNRRSYAPMFVGKRDQGFAPMFVGKKRDMGMIPLFVGRRENGLAPMFVGKKERVPMFVGRRGAVPLFIGTRGHAPMFVGKRGSDTNELPSLDNNKVKRGKRRVEFASQSEKDLYASHSMNKRSYKRFDAPYFVGKRQDAPYFVGKRQDAPYFVGKRQDVPYFVGKRQGAPYFVGKRQEAPFFVGKRQSPSTIDLLNAVNAYEAAKQYRLLMQTDKRFKAPLFIGRRSSTDAPDLHEKRFDAPYFVGKRFDAPYFVGKRFDAPYFVGKRYEAPYFVGKRHDAPYFVGKREEAPYFVGKRFDAPYFVGKRQSESVIDLLNALHAYEAAKQYRRLIQADKRFEAPLFVGKRSNTPLQSNDEESIDSLA
ncbi:MIP-related peptides-like [Gigantopelta aegis]|uniref:MIP-related peptides-like n=1 Tax=Gigantopelta aegis TaxID=1735272 RepID=UPI001B88B6BD|nr:MIP-related peptides-like [Gigantopelta aegis]XP_041349878.1 MIP-related peptides-like [Gigantopelta aegis]